jgi:hypothetical protein
MKINFSTFYEGVNIGVTKGFQWLDGSFMEDIEMIERRPPRDIDIVTFFYLPGNLTQKSLVDANPKIFNRSEIKKDHKVDAFFRQLKNENLEGLIRGSIYWYSLWSHRRDDLWKGYLQIDLAPKEDQAARTNLDAIMSSGGQA